MTTATTFDISGRGLKLDTAADVADHVAQLATMPDLETVNLSGNTFGVGACQALASALADKHRLRVCNYSDMFTGRLKSEIPDCLTALTGVLINKPLMHTLDLSDNAFGPAGADPLVPFLSRTTSLHTLRLNNNGLGISGGTTVAAALTAQAEAHKAAGRKSPLRVFVAGRNRLENGSAPLLAAAFAAHGGLEHVQMPQNGIRPEGIADVLEALATAAPNLHTLDLQDNTFTASGAASLARALPSWPHLRFLNVGDCLLSAKGGRVLARALVRRRGTNSIQTLLLGFNEMDGKAAALVAQWISEGAGEALVKVDLNGNCFGEDSDEAQALRDAMARWDKADALVALDEMEEPDSDVEEDEEEDEEESDVEDEKDAVPTTATAAASDSAVTDALAKQLEALGI